MTASIELCYTGDYPGYPCLRINDSFATREQEKALCEIFKVDGLRELYDKVGAKLISTEHEHTTCHLDLYIA